MTVNTDSPATALRSPRNPFSTRFVRPGAIAYRFDADCDLSVLLGRLQANRWCGQIIGPHGSGKSTLLATLTVALSTAGREVRQITLHDGQRALPSTFLDRAGLSATTQLIVDGYEQLSGWSRFRMRQFRRRQGCGLLVTAHATTGLPTLFVTRTSVRATTELVRLLEQQQQSGEPSTFDAEDIAAAYLAAGGNVREALFALYDLHEQRAGKISSRQR